MFLHRYYLVWMQQAERCYSTVFMRLRQVFGVTDHAAAYEVTAAEQYAQISKIGAYAKVTVVVCIALLGLLVAKIKLAKLIAPVTA